MNFGFKFDTSYFSLYNISDKDKIQDKELIIYLII